MNIRQSLVDAVYSAVADLVLCSRELSATHQTGRRWPDACAS